MPTKRPFRFKLAIKLLLALVAIAGQSAAVSVSAIPDDAGAAAHVERSGVSLHHAHNEATCVMCRVLSLHGRTEAPAAPSTARVIAPTAPPVVLASRFEQHTLPSNPSRAPPEIA